MHNFLISVAGSFVGIGLLLAFTVIINLFLEEGEDNYVDFVEQELVNSIDAVWAEILTIEQQLEMLRDDFEQAFFEDIEDLLEDAE